MDPRDLLNDRTRLSPVGRTLRLDGSDDRHRPFEALARPGRYTLVSSHSVGAGPGVAANDRSAWLGRLFAALCDPLRPYMSRDSVPQS
jgi:hypothetical protein